MIKFIEGNLLEQDDIMVLCHQVNCLGAMGKGIALQIKRKWPHVFYKYREICLNSHNGGHELLGKMLMIPIAPRNSFKRYIANLFGEYSYRECAQDISPHESWRNTDYGALENSLQILYREMEERNLSSLGIPYGMGCGLAGGRWNERVYPMIEEVFSNDPKITCYIVSLIRER